MLRQGLSAAAVALTAAALTACTTMPEPEYAGQFGRVQINEKPVTGIMVSVFAPAADICTFNGEASWRKREIGYHDFLFTPGIWSSPTVARIDCRAGDDTPVTRSLGVPFDELSWRRARTSSTIGAALVSGPLALITGPLAAEMTKDTYRFPPVLIHNPAPSELTQETRETSREAAVTRWRDLETTLKRECDAKTRSRKDIVMGYACRWDFFVVLREADLSVFAR